MAEFIESLLHFDSSGLDINENPSNTENHLCAVDEISEAVPVNAEVTPQCDVTFSESLQLLESSAYDIEKSGNTDNSGLQNVYVDNENSSAFSETLPSVDITSTSPTNCIQLSEMTNDIPTNKLETLPSDVNVDNTNNRSSDSGIHDSQNNIVEDTNMIDFTEDILNISNNCKGMFTEFSNEENCEQVKDEEFHDAVQFFKDPSSFSCLENAGSASVPSEPLITRSSLYVNFDPLHAKFYSQSVACNELQGIVEHDIEPEVSSEGIQSDDMPKLVDKEPQGIVEHNIEPEVSSDGIQNDDAPKLVNKHLANVSPRESLGNILISFDSPLSSKDKDSQPVENAFKEPPKIYTEEEFQQALKIQELSLQETFLKNQHDVELTRSQKLQELEARIEKENHLCTTYYCLIKDITNVALTLSEKVNMLQEKLEIAEKENNKLKEDVKTSVEDLQSVENTFSDFHKRYEQCKSMLKTYTQNENNLKLQLENMKIQLQEKEEMYKVLQSRTEEMLDKANTEVASVKKAGDAQVAVLKAQLKKAELKISSLESDVKHVKIENSKLSSICDELMTKVSEG